MFTAESYEPFTLIGFVRTSWLIGKSFFFFFNKKVTTRLSIYCVSLFPFIFNKKFCKLSFKFMHDCLQFGLIGRVVLPLLIFQLMEYTIITSAYHLVEYTYFATNNLAVEVEP